MREDSWVTIRSHLRTVSSEGFSGPMARRTAVPAAVPAAQRRGPDRGQPDRGRRGLRHPVPAALSRPAHPAPAGHPRARPTRPPRLPPPPPSPPPPSPPPPPHAPLPP